MQSEATSLLSELTASEESKSINQVTASEVEDESSHRTGISGMTLIRTLTCWQLFSVLGLLTGIGLMTINNIGHDVSAHRRFWILPLTLSDHGPLVPLR